MRQYFADVDLPLATDDVDAPLLTTQRLAALLRVCVPPAINALVELSSPSQRGGQQTFFILFFKSYRAKRGVTFSRLFEELCPFA